MTDNELDRDVFQEQLRRLDEMFPGIEILNNKLTEGVFSIIEAFSIKELLFPHYELKYLFAKEVH